MRRAALAGSERSRRTRHCWLNAAANCSEAAGAGCYFDGCLSEQLLDVFRSTGRESTPVSLSSTWHHCICFLRFVSSSFSGLLHPLSLIHISEPTRLRRI